MTASDSVFLENSLVWGKSIRFSLFLLSLLSSFLSPPPLICICLCVWRSRATSSVSPHLLPYLDTGSFLPWCMLLLSWSAGSRRCSHLCLPCLHRGMGITDSSPLQLTPKDSSSVPHAGTWFTHWTISADQLRKTLYYWCWFGKKKKNHSSFASDAYSVLWNLSIGSHLVLRKTLWCDDCTHFAYQEHRGRCITLSSYPVGSRPGLALRHLHLDSSWYECDTRLPILAIYGDEGLGCGQRVWSQTITTILSQQFFLSAFLWPYGGEWAVVGSHIHNIYVKRCIQGAEGMA